MARQPEEKETGLGKRLADQMKRAGYVDQDAEYGVAVQRFSFDHRIAIGLVYKWLGEESVPTRTNLIRIAGILGTTPGMLLFGPDLERPPEKKKRRLHPISGGSDAPAAMRYYVNHIAQWCADFYHALCPPQAPALRPCGA